jgi:hypothetical protein
MGNIRNGVMPGWLGFWQLRATPQGDYRQPRHGNTTLGGYTKAARGSAKNVRVLRAMLRGVCPTDNDWMVPQPPGWRLFRYVRGAPPVSSSSD